jgi:hypothetical protein
MKSLRPSAVYEGRHGRFSIDKKDRVIRFLFSKNVAGPSWMLMGLLLGLTSACEERDLTVPTADDVEEAFTYQGALSASMSGNVAVVTVTQPERQIRRGGTLWAKVGPYVVLFSQEAEGLFRNYPGLAGIRVVTKVPGGTEVARALLPRNRLNDLTWRRALNISGLARRDGTRRPTLLEDLVNWGEDHTDFEYNPRFTRS